MSAIEQPERIDFERIKAMAEELRCPVADLLVLARQNDPFYVGTPADIKQAEWFQSIWKRGGFRHGAHLRRVHYWAVSQAGLLQPNGKPYANTEVCWNYLCQASKSARYLGLVSIADVADRKNPEPHVYASYNDYERFGFGVYLGSLQTPDIDIAGFDESKVQPYHLEVWIEKSTMNDVLIPVCASYRANLVTGEGEMSITAVHELIGRIQEAKRPTRIFYISDFDPAGQSMPRAVARKIEWMLHENLAGFDVRLRPLALTHEQVIQYKLPRTPIKESERRASAFEERNGEGAVELDALEALHPGVFASIVTNALAPYHSTKAVAELGMQKSRLKEAIKVKVDAIMERYTEEIKALEEVIREELDNIEIDDLKAYEPKRAQADVDDGQFEWLFDSRRSYLDQLSAYKGTNDQV